MGDSNKSSKPNKKIIKTKILRIGKRRIKLSRIVDVKNADELGNEEFQQTKRLPSVSESASEKKGIGGLYQRFKERNNRRPKGWRIFWQVFWIAVATGCVMAVVGLGLAVTWMINAPELDMTKFDFNSATTINDINGDYYQQLQTAESRIPVEIEDVPEVVQLAFVAIEDQRFYSHNGVDLRGTIKAVLSVLFSGSTEGPGGSTITQQLIKLTHLTSEVSIKRKVMEWKLAVQLENQMTKREILEAYLNKVNMSYTWGIQSAAKLYFNKDVSQLTIAQAAVLASIINSPSYYNPYLYETDADGNTILSRTQNEDGTYKIAYDSDNQERALTVIAKMRQLGFISDEEYEIAKNDLENNLIALVEPTDMSTYSYFTDAVYQQVLEDIMEKYNYTEDAATDLLLNGGLIINSTVDPIIQNALEVTATDDSNFPSQTSSAAKASAAMTAYSGTETNYIPQVAAVVIENQTGYVVGIIGGRGEKSGSLTLNRALTKHQTGSATKPITVYAPGIDTGILTMATTFDNNKIDFGGWVVTNSPATYTGMMTCRAALVGSVNVVAVQAQRKVGNEISADYAERFGFEIVREGTSNDMNSAALALGGYTYGQTTLALASAFTVFPNGGYRITPTFYTTVTDSNGVVILTAEQETVQVISEQTAWIVTSALKQVVKGGTTYRSVSGQEIGGKTGTTDSSAIACFAGFTARYTGAVWYGYDYLSVTINGTTYDLELGTAGGASDGPAEFWEDAFQKFYSEKALPSENLPSMPDGIFSASVDSVSGKAPTELTALDPRGSTIISEYFIDGTYPSESDDMHQEVEICAETGLLAGENCTNVIKKVMIVKDPAKLLPEGASYRESIEGSTEIGVVAPTTVCTTCTADKVTGLDFSRISSGNTIVTSGTVKEDETLMLYLRTVSSSGVKAITTESPVYTSSDANIFTVTGNGTGTATITGVMEGTAELTASVTYNAGTSKEYTVARTITITVTEATTPTPGGSAGTRAQLLRETMLPAENSAKQTLEDLFASVKKGKTV